MLYAAYALAFELGEWDVYGMVDRMTAKQFLGWLDFFKVREELAKNPKQETEEGVPLERKIMSAFKGYQQRRGDNGSTGQ